MSPIKIEDEELAPVSLVQSDGDWVADFGKCVSGITGSLTNNDLRGIVAHTKADVAGSFNCSNSLLNEIFEMAEHSARQNTQQGIISVDANREQSSWTADSHNIGIGLLYNHRHTLVPDKILRDYAGEQMPDGRFWACSPTPIYEIPGYSMVFSEGRIEIGFSGDVPGGAFWIDLPAFLDNPASSSVGIFDPDEHRVPLPIEMPSLAITVSGHAQKTGGDQWTTGPDFGSSHASQRIPHCESTTLHATPCGSRFAKDAPCECLAAIHDRPSVFQTSRTTGRPGLPGRAARPLSPEFPHQAASRHPSE